MKVKQPARRTHGSDSESSSSSDSESPIEIQSDDSSSSSEEDDEEDNPKRAAKLEAQFNAEVSFAGVSAMSPH